MGKGKDEAEYCSLSPLQTTDHLKSIFGKYTFLVPTFSSLYNSFCEPSPSSLLENKAESHPSKVG